MVGQREAAFKGAGGDAAVQISAALVGLALPGGDMQMPVLHLDRQFVGRKAGNGDRDAKGVIGRLSML